MAEIFLKNILYRLRVKKFELHLHSQTPTGRRKVLQNKLKGD
jgi:hypothetical protein